MNTYNVRTKNLVILSKCISSVMQKMTIPRELIFNAINYYPILKLNRLSNVIYLFVVKNIIKLVCKLTTDDNIQLS